MDKKKNINEDDSNSVSYQNMDLNAFTQLTSSNQTNKGSTLHVK